jgi:hypothetical protein
MLSPRKFTQGRQFLLPHDDAHATGLIVLAVQEVHEELNKI